MFTAAFFISLAGIICISVSGEVVDDADQLLDGLIGLLKLEQLGGFLIQIDATDAGALRLRLRQLILRLALILLGARDVAADSRSQVSVELRERVAVGYGRIGELR